VYSIDKPFSALRPLGSPVELGRWYDQETTIRHALFICGSEELLLVDSNHRARIFSFTTQMIRYQLYHLLKLPPLIHQLRPSTLQLRQLPSAVYSSPDGSCFITSTASVLHAYHWATFGASEGVPLQLPMIQYSQDLLLTSLVNRNNVHLLTLDLAKQCCQSVVLDITKRSTELTFKQKGFKVQGNKDEPRGFHNPLVDCHSEVWTRFPVAAAVRRKIFVSSDRKLKSLVFVADKNHCGFSRYFSEMIYSFERQTKKPTEEELRSIQLSAMTFDAFTRKIAQFDISRFRAGEWLVDLLCLIPIHIAVTQENRFVPLKDGVLSAEVERSLLGADVGQIVDSLSFGWYESLFQSYQSSKVIVSRILQISAHCAPAKAGQGCLIHGYECSLP